MNPVMRIAEVVHELTQEAEEGHCPAKFATQVRRILVNRLRRGHVVDEGIIDRFLSEMASERDAKRSKPVAINLGTEEQRRQRQRDREERRLREIEIGK